MPRRVTGRREPALMCREQVTSRYDADQFPGRFRPHNWQTADVRLHHQIRGIASRGVLRYSDRRTLNDVSDPCVDRELEIEEISPRHDAEQTAIAREHGKALMARALSTRGHPITEVLHRIVRL